MIKFWPFTQNFGDPIFKVNFFLLRWCLTISLIVCLRSYHNILENVLFKIYSLFISSHWVRKSLENTNYETLFHYYLFVPDFTLAIWRLTYEWRYELNACVPPKFIWILKPYLPIQLYLRLGLLEGN